MEGQRGCCLVFEQVSMADFGSYVCQVEKKDQRCSSEVAELDVTPGDGKSEFTGLCCFIYPVPFTQNIFPQIEGQMNVHLNEEFICVTFFSSHFDGFMVADLN